MSGAAMLNSRNRPSMARSGDAVAVVADSHPACGQRMRVVRAGIERRDVVEALTAGVQELLAAGDDDFLQGLEAIHCKARTDDGDAAPALRSQLHQHAVGGRLQPACGAETRLERQPPLLVSQVE